MALVPFPSSRPAASERDEPVVALTDPIDPEDPGDNDELDGSGARMSFLEHLDELRKRLIHAVVSVAVGVGMTFYFHDAIYQFVFEPTRRVLPEGSKLIY